MRLPVTSCLVALLITWVAVSPLHAADAPPLTAAEAKALVSAGQYPDALRALTRILDLRGQPAAAYDRHEMLMLKAECLLQTRQASAALAIVEIAKKDALTAANDDQLLEASAFGTLIKASPAFIYTPQTGKVRKPISILDRALRGAAYDALFADQFTLVKTKAVLAKRGGKLPPVADAASDAAKLRALEKASTGKTEQADEILADLSTTAQQLIVTDLDKLNADVRVIAESADRLVSEDVAVQDRRTHEYYAVTITHRLGLGNTDVQNLNSIITEAAKVAAAANDLAQFFSNDAAPFKKLTNSATITRDKARTVLATDYSRF